MLVTYDRPVASSTPQALVDAFSDAEGVVSVSAAPVSGDRATVIRSGRTDGAWAQAANG